MEYCECIDVRGVKDALSDILDECVEFIKEPSMDEFSDIMFGIGRLTAGVFGKKYVRMPFDRLHIEKNERRMKEYGCVRSARAIAAGDGCKVV